MPGFAPEVIGVFFPAGAESALEWVTGSDALVLWIPEDAFEEFAPTTDRHPIALQASPLTTGFRTFVRSLLEQEQDSSSVADYAIERLLIEMAFGSMLEFSSVESRADSMTLLERARSVMLLHREDADFTSTDLAAELHVSLRHLQRVFSEIGTTPGEEMRAMRVDLAMALLTNPVYRALSVEEVARYSGFSGGLQLRRALHSSGHPAPSSIRRESATG